MRALTPPDPSLLARLDPFVAPVLRCIEERRLRRLARAYLDGLLGPIERKTAEPIARMLLGAKQAPAYERRMQAMLSDPAWSYRSVMLHGIQRVLDQTDGWQAYALDDTALLKQGEHSVGVANQYAGCLGALAQCQVLVSLSLVQEHVSAPCLARLFLPDEWADDAGRRSRCHVPADVTHQPKWQLGLDLLRTVRWGDLPKRPVLIDSAYGRVVAFRRTLQDWDLAYVAAVPLETTVWAPGTVFAPPLRVPGRRSSRGLCPQGGQEPHALVDFATRLPTEVWQTVCWRDGSRGPQLGRFAAVRVRPAHGWKDRSIAANALLAEEWLLLFWPVDKNEPERAWLSNLSVDTSLVTLITYARLRWRIERDYQEGKGLVGLDHYEGRSWHGLHHHVALVYLAQQFLAAERFDALRAGLPPTTANHESASVLQLTSPPAPLPHALSSAATSSAAFPPYALPRAARHRLSSRRPYYLRARGGPAEADRKPPPAVLPYVRPRQSSTQHPRTTLLKS